MGTAVAPRLDVTVSEARKLAGQGLAGARGLARGRWIVVGIALGIVGLTIALLVRERDPVLAQLSLAPVDDEPVTPEERSAIDAAREEQGEISLDPEEDLAVPSARGSGR